jgi:hypothetical protein
MQLNRAHHVIDHTYVLLRAKVRPSAFIKRQALLGVHDAL